MVLSSTQGVLFAAFQGFLRFFEKGKASVAYELACDGRDMKLEHIYHSACSPSIRERLSVTLLKQNAQAARPD